MHPVLHLGEVFGGFFIIIIFRHRSGLFRLDRYMNGRVRRFRFCVLLRFGTRDGMAWYEYVTKMCCRYLFSCEKKEKKKRDTTGAGSRFYATLYINVSFLLLHKNMTRWLDPTRTFFWGE